MSESVPTTVRYRVISVTTLVAVMLYLDRICIAEIAKLDAFKNELGLTATQTGAILSSFFFAYALARFQLAGCLIVSGPGACYRSILFYGQSARR